MFRKDPAGLRAMLEQLETATRNHAEWQGSLIRTIACRVGSDPDDLADDAHERCRFGRWYYGQVPSDLHEEPAFVSIETEHRAVHREAARLLREVAAGAPIECADYDAFVAAESRLRLELDSLRHEIQGALRSSDVLTGAYGRSELVPELREWRELVRRNVARCCVAFMDVDHLKAINDRNGHTVGDRVLAGLVEYVTGHLRPYDKVFRYGGDEFLLLLPQAALPDAQKAIERIRSGLERAPLFECPDGETIRLTASFGLVELDPEVTAEESVDRADKALLLAKASGRNRVVSWDPSVTTGTQLSWSDAQDG
jgi:diguanylate cyclase (GGDEF)-like protein